MMKSWETIEPPRAPAKTIAFTRRRVGDLVIGFRAGPPVAMRRRPEPWSPVATDSDWQLWEQPPGPGWKGYPLTEIQTAGWRIWLLGELYGWPGSEAERAQSLAELVRGERAASTLNGHLLLWAWEEGPRRWHVWTNRFGTLHGYYAGPGPGAALGVGFQTVARLASRRQLDWPALAGFFGFGFFPDDRTHYTDVRILRPATHHVFGAQGNLLGARRYWEWRCAPDERRGDADTVAEFAGVFGAVMSELVEPLTDRVALPLSGGLDSRCTVAALGAELPSGLANRLWSYSYGYVEDSVETRIARQVAAARGLPFNPFTIKPYLFGRLEEILSAMEGFQDLTQCRQAFVTEALGHRADAVIAAHWGDVWLDDLGLVGRWLPISRGAGPPGRQIVAGGGDSDELVLAHTLGKLLKPGRAWLLTHLCAPRVDAPENLLVDFVRTGLDRLRGLEDPEFRVKAFKTDRWSFRWTLASLRMLQGAAFPRLPFYDSRLADFFATVPSARLGGRRLQIAYLQRFAPDLARIEWQARGADLYHGPKRGPWALAGRAARKIRQRLAGVRTIERNWEVQFGGEQGRAGLARWLLRPGLRLHELVSPGNIAALLREFEARPMRAGRGYTVAMLLTFSAWLESEAQAVG